MGKMSSVRASFGSCSGPQNSNAVVDARRIVILGFPVLHDVKNRRIGMTTGFGTVGEWTAGRRTGRRCRCHAMTCKQPIWTDVNGGESAAALRLECPGTSVSASEGVC
jgi:hypothetical protein